jgi:hypothetical protein
MSTTKLTAVVATVVCLLVATMPVSAHHAFAAEFDVNQPVTLTGVMTKWDMVNPHSWFYIDVTGPDGEVVSWMVEGGSPNTLIRMGVTKNTVQAGQELTIEGYLAKDGSDKAVGRNFILPDGTRLFVGGSAPGADGGGR